MARIERVGVSIEEELLLSFDKLITKQGYQSRSEAIRDLIRQQLSKDKLTNSKAQAIATVFLVYNHHSLTL